MALVLGGNDHLDQSGAKVALITGINGQDGSYLAEFLLEKGYQVHGLIRYTTKPDESCDGSTSDTSELTTKKSIKLHFCDLNDILQIVEIMMAVKPSEIYNLAAMSHVKMSFEMTAYTTNIDALGPLRILESIRICGLEKNVRFYQASSSELFGRAQNVPQDEKTPFYPRSPYATAKLFAYHTTINFREAYGMFAVNGILFNHESPRRGFSFVTRKISRAVARVHLNQQQTLELGSLDSKRDWGHACDFVEAMWLMLQYESPEDFVIATGEVHSVREFVELAFQEINRELVWEGFGKNEIGKEKQTNIVRVTINPDFIRPTEENLLIGNAKKAEQKLNWKPKTSFKALVVEMVQADIELLERTACSHSPITS